MKENKDKEENLIKTNNTNNNQINDIPPTLNNNLQSHLVHSNGIKKNMDMIYGTFSNDVVLVENCEEFQVRVAENKRMRSIILYNSTKVNFTVLDSAVIMTRTMRLVNLSNSAIVISDADIRRVELWGCKKVIINVFLSQIQAENMFILIHHDCEDITLKYGEMKVDLKDMHPYNEIINEVKVPKFAEENKIILARCTKIPLFDIFLYDQKDPIFLEKFEFLKSMTKTIEFANEKTNKSLHDLVQIIEVINAIEDLKSATYNLTQEDIKKQYNLEKTEYREKKETC